MSPSGINKTETKLDYHALVMQYLIDSNNENIKIRDSEFTNMKSDINKSCCEFTDMKSYLNKIKTLFTQMMAQKQIYFPGNIESAKV